MMITLLVTDRDGELHRLQAHTGMSVMENIQSLPDSVEAVCGGNLSCATCHVYIDQAWLGRLDDMSAEENELLEGVIDRRADSRLSCQLRCDRQLDGLALTIAPACV